jgi:hypothetical protein
VLLVPLVEFKKFVLLVCAVVLLVGAEMFVQPISESMKTRYVVVYVVVHEVFVAPVVFVLCDQAVLTWKVQAYDVFVFLAVFVLFVCAPVLFVNVVWY